jgi:hypothetical protein
MHSVNAKLHKEVTCLLVYGQVMCPELVRTKFKVEKYKGENMWGEEGRKRSSSQRD